MDNKAWVIFVITLDRILAGDFPKRIHGPQPTLLAIPASEINTMRGIYWELQRDGAYTKKAGIGWVPTFAKFTNRPPDPPPGHWAYTTGSTTSYFDAFTDVDDILEKAYGPNKYTQGFKFPKRP